MTIIQLPAELANQIAAGEVVAGPCSIVKELVENAIDAGASKVEIELEDAGKSLIRVVDNGEGIAKDDLSKTVLRHATSKIKTFADLEQICSMGFRGEALASISSVSRLRISSKQADAVAWRLCCEGESSEQQQLDPCQQHGNTGTVVEVWDLFFRVPARQKFLASTQAELRRVRDIVKRLALAHTEVSFRLSHAKKVLLDVPTVTSTQQEKQRMAAILGDAFTQECLHLDVKVPWGRVHGWCAKALFNRSQADMQFLILNHRPIRDKHLAFAMKRAYIDILPPGRQPAYCVHLQMDFSKVDVNVHPSKDQVRFAEPDAVIRALKHAVASRLRQGSEGAQIPQKHIQSIRTESLPEHFSATVSTKQRQQQAVMQYAQAELRGNASTDNLQSPGMGLGRDQYADNERQLESRSMQQAVVDNNGEQEVVGESKNTEARQKIPAHDHSGQALSANTAKPSSSGGLGTQLAMDARAVLEQSPGRMYRRIAHSFGQSPQSNCIDPEPVDKEQSLDLGQSLGQLHGVYLLAQNKQGLIMVDIHAAHERIGYEALKLAYAQQGVVMQKLLVAQKLNVDTQTSSYVQDNPVVLSQLGFEIKLKSEHELEITAIPTLLAKANILTVVEDVLMDLQTHQNSSRIDEALHKVFATMSCHAAVRANQLLSRSEMDALLRQIEATDGSEYCNHGRPTWFVWPLSKIDKVFSRGE